MLNIDKVSTLKRKENTQWTPQFHLIVVIVVFLFCSFHFVNLHALNAHCWYLCWICEQKKKVKAIKMQSVFMVKRQSQLLKRSIVYGVGCFVLSMAFHSKVHFFTTLGCFIYFSLFFSLAISCVINVNACVHQRTKNSFAMEWGQKWICILTTYFPLSSHLIRLVGENENKILKWENHAHTICFMKKISMQTYRLAAEWGGVWPICKNIHIKNHNSFRIITNCLNIWCHE